MTAARSFNLLSCLLFASIVSISAAFSAPSMENANKVDERLLELSQKFIKTASGVFGPLDPDLYAEDFVFRGGVVGPLNKQDYLDTMEKLGIYKHFELEDNAFGHSTIEDANSRRIRYFIRMTGQQTKPWQVTNVPYSFGINNDPVRGPTESHLLEFNEKGQIRMFVLGAPMLFGNPEPVSTGKFGAVLGLISHTGNPEAAASATVELVRTVTNKVAGLLGNQIGPPMTASKPEDVPAWWYEQEEKNTSS